MDTNLFQFALRCKCPRCREGDLFRARFDLALNDKCHVCGLDLAKNDSADGPAVFLIFVLGFLLVPMALVLDALVSPPLWVHGALWGGVALAVTLGLLRPLKAYVIALQFKHRPGDWS
ncbi:MAG: DUF983 domain-containing protein [Alphaproteobacteria bacterium]|nr:DUF983 domain-containing protein [Alphaproteobacteria bacterium]MCB9975274.1 DUF983 domain-containing protein [Rhodospirillales bacterium]